MRALSDGVGLMRLNAERLVGEDKPADTNIKMISEFARMSASVNAC